MPTPPILMLTNDDGFDATGIKTFRAALQDRGAHVVTIAPERNHTAGSHRVSVGEDLTLTRVGPDSFVCSGTPVDCVRVGVLSGVVPLPDLVVSGINHGANAGEDVHYSGTVAAAVEAALLGVPALAVSQDGDGRELPFITQEPHQFPDVDYAARTALWTATHGLPDGALLSLNLPLNPMRGPAKLTKLGQRDWRRASVEVLEHDSDQFVLRPWAVEPPAILTPGSDFALLADGVATISMLSAQSGLRDILDEYRNWVEPLTRL